MTEREIEGLTNGGEREAIAGKKRSRMTEEMTEN
jgi:hypothetical protein